MVDVMLIGWLIVIVGQVGFSPSQLDDTWYTAMMLRFTPEPAAAVYIESQRAGQRRKTANLRSTRGRVTLYTPAVPVKLINRRLAAALLRFAPKGSF
jgi:hypothetical protein